MEAINKAGASVGILTNEGVILASEKQDVSSLLEKS
jgi:20S proteasome subunit alpha 3